MAIKDQLHRIKENWLIAVVIVLLLAFSFFSNSNSPPFDDLIYRTSTSMEKAVPSSEVGAVAREYYHPAQEGFAPEVKDRKITKTTSLSQEVERGYFDEAQKKLESIITATDSYLLYENVYRSGTGRNLYYSGSYQIKVDNRKYDAVVTQLKDIGEVTSFSENAQDVTAQYTNLKVELDTEKSRLQRYQQMYAEAATVTEKIEVSDRIFNQERTIKYIEDSLENVDQQVYYSTISVQLTEKQSSYATVVFVTFSELVRGLVHSINSLLSLLFWILPYAIVVAIVWFVIRRLKKKK